MTLLPVLKPTSSGARRQNISIIRRLRRRIVLLVTLTSGFVVLCAFLSIMASTWSNQYQEVHRSLLMALKAGPVETVVFNVGKSNSPAGASTSTTVYYNSYRPTVVYVLNSDGQIMDSNEDAVSIDSDLRDSALAAALASSSAEGHLANEGLFYAKSGSGGETIVAFTDATIFMGRMASTAWTLVVVGVVIMLALFALSLVLARLITRPVLRNGEQQAKFIADASHELKTPLTVLIANTDIMLSHPEFTAEERAVWLEGNKAEAAHMRGLIDDMLTLARGEQFDVADPTTLPELDLSALVESAALAFEAVAFERGVTIQETVEPGIKVRGDEAQLERMVKTFVDNAVKYSAENGVVDVRLSRQRPGHPRISVHNMGVPLAKEDLPHVFDRFWRSSSARERNSQGGYGLGLSIAKSIADAHNARIGVTSDAAHGTTFYVEF